MFQSRDEAPLLRVLPAWQESLKKNYVLDAEKAHPLEGLNIPPVQLDAMLKQLFDWEQHNPEFMREVAYKEQYFRCGVLRGHKGHVNCVQSLPDGRIASGGQDGQLRVWSAVGEGEWTHRSFVSHEESITMIQLLPDGRIVSGGDDGIVRVWEEDGDGNWTCMPLVGTGHRITFLKTLPSGQIFSGDSHGKICLFSALEDGEWSKQLLYGHEDSVQCLSVLPQGTMVSGGDDRRVLLWKNTGPGRWEKEELNGHHDSVDFVKFLPRGRILSGGSDTLLRIWDRSSSPGWRPFLFGQRDHVTLSHACVRYGRDGVVIVGSDGSVIEEHRELPDGTWKRKELACHEDYTVFLQELPDGRIVSADNARKIKVTTRLGSGSTKSETLNCGIDLEEMGILLRNQIAHLLVEHNTSILSRCSTLIQSMRDYVYLGGGLSTFPTRLQVTPEGKILFGGCDGRILIWDGRGSEEVE